MRCLLATSSASGGCARGVSAGSPARAQTKGWCKDGTAAKRHARYVATHARQPAGPRSGCSECHLTLALAHSRCDQGVVHLRTQGQFARSEQLLLARAHQDTRLGHPTGSTCKLVAETGVVIKAELVLQQVDSKPNCSPTDRVGLRVGTTRWGSTDWRERLIAGCCSRARRRVAQLAARWLHLLAGGLAAPARASRVGRSSFAGAGTRCAAGRREPRQQ